MADVTIAIPELVAILQLGGPLHDAPCTLDLERPDTSDEPAGGASVVGMNYCWLTPLPQHTISNNNHLASKPRPTTNV